ncbi:MAG: hypothetical protein CMO80_11645 [Verrucomicrobiales bacterium]|nr:hypothetical protein [Verrucomicrobiales bacterium]|tara:strand:- start:23727 stop:25400 length:1674 start_codon:yes stop_codon:yes gene_type:complete
MLMTRLILFLSLASSHAAAPLWKASADQALTALKDGGWKLDQIAGSESVRIHQSVKVPLREHAHYRFSVQLRAERPISKSVDFYLKTVVPPGAFRGTDIDLGWVRTWAQNVGTNWTRFTLDFYPPAVLDSDGKPVEIEVRPTVQLRKPGPLLIGEHSFAPVPVTPSKKAGIAKLRKAISANGAVDAPFSVLGGILPLSDGRLIALRDDFSKRFSTDGGRTWGTATKLAVDDPFDSLSGAIAMSNGDIGIWSVSWEKPIYFWRSSDDGETWSKRITMGPVGAPYHGNCMIELRPRVGEKVGRLVIGVRVAKNYHAGIYEPAGAYGTVHGRRIKVEGHGHDPELVSSFAYYSDDGGRSWSRSEEDVFVWKDEGRGGMWLSDEPNVAELRDGRLVMFLRTTLGRIYQSFSHDRGHRWLIPEPTILPTSISPCSLEALPKGDLLCVWNNVSRAEVSRGLRRARLCSAISKDNGRSWQHVRTLAAIGVEPLNQMAKLDEPAMTRADKELGELPMPFGYLSYPDITVHGGQVLVHYYMTFVRPSMSAGGRLFIRPLDWFYGND